MELSQLTIDSIRSFCDQGLSEGLRLDYKEDFPKELKLVETICAYANTQGGIVLIGVKAETKTNKPIAIPGIELQDGLEEKVINLCLSHISPTITPEVKVCDFRSKPNKKSSDRAVVFIRVRLSYIAPHYILKTNKIPIRVHNRNSQADLRTIESLINRRNEIRSSTLGLPSTRCDSKMIFVENKTFESVVINPQFSMDPLINFNKENDDRLYGFANEALSLRERKPRPQQLFLLSSNLSGQITRCCQIYFDGRLLFQKPSIIEENKLYVYNTISFLIRSLKSAEKIYSHFGFFGDLSIGLTIKEAKDRFLHLGKRRIEEHLCDNSTIYISRDLRYDELSNLNDTIQSIFQELCRYFGATFENKIVVEIVEEIFKTHKSLL